VEKATWDLILTHSLVEPLLAIDKIKNSYTWKQNFVTDAAGEIVKNKYGGTLIPMNMLNNCMQIWTEWLKSKCENITVTASFGILG
jgi:hypothetical protein